MRVVAIIATYNESRFLAVCLENYRRQGVEVVIMDNESTDNTRDIAEQYRGDPVIAIKRIPRNDCFEWGRVLAAKEHLAQSLACDWVMHADADEIRLPPPGYGRLRDAIVDVDRRGYNAINFMEYTFVPVEEAPDHDHERFQETMQWYYPFLPKWPNRLNLWKKQPAGIRTLAWRMRLSWRRKEILSPVYDLRSSGGHKVHFPGINACPDDFVMKHYLVLSRQHAYEKYTAKDFAKDEVRKGFHGWRAAGRSVQYRLPSAGDLRVCDGRTPLDPATPLTSHFPEWIDGVPPWPTGEPRSQVADGGRSSGTGRSK